MEKGPLSASPALTVNKAPFQRVDQHIIKQGVYSLQNNQHPSTSGNKDGGEIRGSGGGGSIPHKSPTANRKPTPAKPHQIHDGKHSQKLLAQAPPSLCPTIEVDEVEDDPSNNTLSPAAQAHSLSLFLSSSTSDSDEPNSETVIAAVYRDPLDDCMDQIEELSVGILRTSKLTVQGEPGDMSKIQPALFGLQAMDKQMPQILLQIMQYPFFGISDKDEMTGAWSELQSDDKESDLLEGHLRLGLPIDTAIYALLRSHSAKGAKQAEAIISTASNYNYNPGHSHVVSPHIPPVICRSSLNHRKSPALRNGYHKSEKSNGDRSVAVVTKPNEVHHPENGLQVYADQAPMKNQASNSSISGRSERSTSGVSVLSSTSTSCSSSSLPNIEEAGYTPSTTPTETTSPSSVPKKRHNTRGRKDSIIHLHPRTASSGSDISLDDYSIQSDRKFIPDAKLWNTSTVDNSIIVSQYGDSTYPLLMWDPRLKVDFRLSSSIGLLTGIVTGIDPDKSTVTMKVTNTTGRKVGFAIRTYRQTTVFKPYVIFPSEGLYVLGDRESERVWEDNVEFYPRDPGKNESFVIDLFVCTFDGTPSWNVQRKYAIMKGHKSSCAPLKRMTKRRPSHFHMPGTMEQKAENLKLIISHGLQCVVKRKFDEAEIILSQALHLPDFQRVPLKAFLYICLGVVADKRKKLGHSKTLMPVLMATNAAHSLVEIVETTPGNLKMPKTVMLVKQLKKELNITKSMKEEHRRVEKQTSIGKLEEKEESCSIHSDGGMITYKSTELVIPAGAVKEPTEVTLSTPDCTQLRTLLKSQGWDKMVHLVAAMHVQCAPFMERFNKSVEIKTLIVNKDVLTLGSYSTVRLLQSKYLHHWQDITDDVCSQCSLMEDMLSVKTDQTGWLAVAIVQYDISQIIQLAMRSLSADPISLQLSTYGLVDTENGSIQVAIFVTPCKPTDDPSKMETSQKPQHHRPIAFPHTIQAYPGEKLRLTLQGGFEPDEQMGETNLHFEFEVQSSLQRILEKWLKITSTSIASGSRRSQDGSYRPLCGKLVVSSCRNVSQQWEAIAEINLSTKTGFSAKNTSSSGSDLSSH